MFSRTAMFGAIDSSCSVDKEMYKNFLDTILRCNVKIGTPKFI
jgi:hypothetical protein